MNTPRRTIRIEDELWDAAQATAQQEGTTVTEVIRDALNAYVKAAGVALVAVLAILTLGGCGVGEPSPRADHSAPTATFTPHVLRCGAPCWEIQLREANEARAAN